MALVSLLGKVDEIYETLERSLQKDGDISFLFHPHTREQFEQRKLQGTLQGIQQKTPDDFHTIINVQSFEPEQISVKVKGHEVVIEGKHEEQEDGHGFIARQFTRRFVIPEIYDMETITTTLDTDGKMTIKAQKPKPIESDFKERVIPIERVASDTEKPSAPVESKVEEKKKDPEYKLEDVRD